MGEHELQEALRGEAQAKIRAVWQAAETAVAARRAEVAAEVVALRDEAARRLAAAQAAEQRTLLTAAEMTARQRLLVAETAVLERLRRLAASLLPELGATQRSRFWQALVAELPTAEWQRVRVHPDDLTLARQTFPAAEVSSEPALGGGLVVEVADGRISVDNSLAGRLARSWHELQTPLMMAVHEEVDKDAADSSPAG